jgi:hypothetical protein
MLQVRATGIKMEDDFPLMEQGAEENIRTEERRSDRRLKKSTQRGAS